MNASIIINYVTSAVTIILGLILVSGVFSQLKNNTMLMFGIVLLIYGVFRLVTTTSKIKQRKLQEKLDSLKSERDKLLK